MFRQIITPANKEDLNFMVHLPENYISKKIEIIAFQVNEVETNTSKELKRKQKKAFATFDKMKVSMKDFKFNREEANKR